MFRSSTVNAVVPIAAAFVSGGCGGSDAATPAEYKRASTDHPTAAAPPSAPSPAAARSTATASRDPITTAAPPRASARARARPSPRDPPVTPATCPSSLMPPPLGSLPSGGQSVRVDARCGVRAR